MTKSKGKKSSRGFASNHQRSWLWGRHAVQETLIAGRWPVVELLLDDELPPEILRYFATLSNSAGVVIQKVTPNRIVELCHADDHQGVLARLGDFPTGDLTSLLNEARTVLQKFKSGSDNPCSVPLYVICDRIQDAHNFGAILRCCDAMKVTGVIIGERAQCAVNPHVVRSSAGAVNHVNIYRVPDLTAAADVLSGLGLSIAAATEKTTEPIWNQDLRTPTALIIGSEAFGVATELLNLCQLRLTIPMLGQVTSLNAAVAAGIILYEFRRQQSIEVEK